MEKKRNQLSIHETVIETFVFLVSFRINLGNLKEYKFN